jgi:hypothetical protein
MSTWEERMTAKHQRPSEIPWREPTFKERLTRPDMGWFRWLPRFLCTTCYEWRRDGPNRLTWFRVCDRQGCKHRHHHNEVWMA